MEISFDDGRLTDMWKVYKSFSGVGSRWLFLRNVLLLHFVETIYGYVAFRALVYFECWCLPHILFSLGLPGI